VRLTTRGQFVYQASVAGAALYGFPVKILAALRKTAMNLAFNDALAKGIVQLMRFIGATNSIPAR
jgi:hypothetical protein